MALAGPNLYFSSFSSFEGRSKVDSGQKWAGKELLCSCRQPLAEIRDFSQHLKSANSESLDSGSKLIHLGQNPP